MIDRIPFGRTGHTSSRVLFGAATLGAMKQDRADATLAKLDHFGINHIDVAASYGEAELRLAPFLKTRRDDFFLATKTGLRTKDEAAKQLRASLARMEVEQIDLIQMHNLTKESEWDIAMGPGGALEALIEARDEGLVRFIGVTGHGTYAPVMHTQSLQAFEFDSILTPYNYTMIQNPQYVEDFDALYELCQSRGVAMQTIKAIALRRWREDDPEKHFSWYKPIREPEALKRAVDFVLSRPGLFLNTTSDASLLDSVFTAADGPIETPDQFALAADAETLGMEPLFVRDVSDDVQVSAG
ncbi:MAG: aldo/keto reductase [Pseudomonadales bacterium]|jgi:aryl-alcohol dehydrogenase-like predicted oxidoreductase|nr:aldo/keto reductase [Pseudomonadales bacterium]